MKQIDVMAFGAHPDDIELFCGGTLIKMQQAGAALILVDLTQGELGSGGNAAIRCQEAEQAAVLMQVAARENLALEDGHIRSTPDAKLRVVRTIRAHRPDMVLLPYYVDRHPDHVQASTLVYEAAFMAGLAQYRTDQDHFRPRRLAYYMLWEPFEPSFIIDVSAQFERKMQAIEAYASQFDPSSQHAANTRLTSGGFKDLLTNRMAYHGSLIGKKYGEAFLIHGNLEVSDPRVLDFTSF